MGTVKKAWKCDVGDIVEVSLNHKRVPMRFTGTVIQRIGSDLIKVEGINAVGKFTTVVQIYHATIVKQLKCNSTITKTRKSLKLKRKNLLVVARSKRERFLSPPG